MKKIIICLFICLPLQQLMAQSVGIGTTTPNASAQLDVTSTNKGLLIPRMTGAQRTAIATPAFGLLVYQTNNELVPPSSIGFYMYETAGWKKIARHDDISWTINGSNQYSNVAGNVGIGTSLPNASALLDVTSTSKGILVPRMTTAQRTAIVSPASGLLVYDNTTNGFWFYNGSSWGQIGSSGTDWLSNANDIYNANIGNVGIGISAPTSKFHLAGNLLQDNGTITMNNAAANIQLQNAGVNKGFMQLSGNHFRIGTNSGNTLGRFIVSTNNTDRIIVDSIGRVGIGSTNPVSKLHIEGGTFVNYGTNNGYIMLGQASSANLAIGNYEILARDNGLAAPLYLQHDGGQVRIGNSGSTAENTRLHITDGTFVNYGANNGYLMLGQSSSANLAIGDYEILARNNGAASPLYLQHDGGQVRIGNTGGTADNTRLHITDGFATGLGSGNGYLMLGLQTANNIVVSNYSIQAKNNGVADDLLVQNNGGAFNVRSGNLVVANNSNVGIGTAAPLEKIHVIGNALLNATNPTIQLQNSSVDKGFIQLSGDNIRIGTNSGNTAGKFVIRTNNGDRFFVDGSGNVNIGSQTDAPGYIFRVGGKMICEEVKVKLQSSGWPDYVFDNNYKLPTLAELEKFIQANKHLPNIPSAAEVEKNGFELGDMQKRMLEKIEELTLYVIELKKQVDELKKK